MNNWYEVKVKYTKQLEDGRLKRVTEPYLVDAVSFTDAEARIYEEVGTNVKGEFIVMGIVRKEFADIFYFEDSDVWYKLAVEYVSTDADSGKEKKQKVYFLITASNPKEAYSRLKESLVEMTVTYKVKHVVETKIIEVLPYKSKND